MSQSHQQEAPQANPNKIGNTFLATFLLQDIIWRHKFSANVLQ